MPSRIKTDRFVFALRAYKAATKKDAASVLNRAARNVAFRASQNTRKVSPNKIRRELMKDPHLRYALTALSLKKRGIGHLQSPAFQKEVDRLVSRRASSAGYLRSGWAQAIQDLGGNFRGAKYAGAGGFANKATINRLIVNIVNTTTQRSSARVQGAEIIGEEALKKAIAYVAEDMIGYARQLMGYTAKEFSAR